VPQLRSIVWSRGSTNSGAVMARVVSVHVRAAPDATVAHRAPFSDDEQRLNEKNAPKARQASIPQRHKGGEQVTESAEGNGRTTPMQGCVARGRKTIRTKEFFRREDISSVSPKTR